MSLLLDALKKAAEKNANNAEEIKKDSLATKPVSDSDITEQIAQKHIEKTLFAQDEAQQTEVIKEETVHTDVDQKTLEDKVTNLEGLSSLSVEEVDGDHISDTPSEIESLELQESATEASFLEDLEERLEEELGDDDPSLKLALSDEEIVLTDDDVTEFLGSNEIDFDDGGLSLKDQSEIDIPQTSQNTQSDSTLTNNRNSLLDDQTSTQSLNLVDTPHPDGTISQSLTDSAPTITGGMGLGQTTNLNSLTNESTVTVQDSTTKTFGTDNYDRTLVKLEEDVSKVFTGMKSENPGAAMTPDFAKKVFVSKSTSLRRRNYKWYAIISLVLLISIAVFALFEMQTQMDDIDSSLVRLKQNPVPAKLRFEKPKQQNSLAVLEGKVDTEALALLKSMEKSAEESAKKVVVNRAEKAEKTKDDEPLSPKQKPLVEEKQIPLDRVKLTEKVGMQSLPKQLKTSSKTTTTITKKPAASAKPLNGNLIVNKKPASIPYKASGQSIAIKSKIKEKPESVLLRSAYKAYEQGDLDQALKDYNQVLELDATNRDALLGQAAIYSSQDQTSLAIDNYQKLLQENPKDTLAMTSLIAVSNMSPVESESRLKLLQREAPKASYLQFALGNVLSAQNRWQEAQQHYFEAYQADSNNADYAYNLAVSMEQIGKPEVAIGFYRRALKNAEIKSGSFDELLAQQRIEVLSQ